MWDSPEALARASDPEASPTWLGAAAMRSLPLALAIAANPAATPRILGTIAERWKDARAVVCRNPRTRRRLLFLLAREHPDAFLANARAETLVRATDRAAPITFLRVLLARKDAPSWLRPAMTEHPFPDVRALVASDSEAPTEVLVALARDSTAEVRAAAAAHPRLPETELARLARDAVTAVRSAVAWRTDAPLDAQTILAEDPDEWVRSANARRARSPELVRKIATTSDWFVPWSLAENPATPPDLLARLLVDASDHLRRKIVANPNATPAMLEELVLSADRDVRAAVIANANATRAVLERFARSPDVEERKRAAQSPRLPLELRRELAHDADAWVRWYATYYASDEALLRELATHSDPSVRHRVADAARALGLADLLASLADDADARVREQVAQSPRVPPAVLARLADDPSDDVRLRVAMNEATPAEAIARLAHDLGKEGLVSRWALTHPKLSDIVLVAALVGPQRERAGRVLRERIDRPETSAETFRALATRGPDAEALVASCTHLPAALGQQIARSGTFGARVALAKTTTDASVVRILVEDREPAVRKELAARGVADARLAADPSREVRLTLARHTADPVLAERFARADADFRRAVARSANAPPNVLVALADDPDPDVRAYLPGNPDLPLDALLRLRRRGGPEGLHAKERLRMLGHPKGR